MALPEGGRRHEDAARGSYGWLDTEGGSGTADMPYAWEVPVEVGADGFVPRRPRTSTADDPMWQDYQFVAMLDPVELADGIRATRAPAGTPRPRVPRPWTCTGWRPRTGRVATRGGRR